MLHLFVSTVLVLSLLAGNANAQVCSDFGVIDCEANGCCLVGEDCIDCPSTTTGIPETSTTGVIESTSENPSTTAPPETTAEASTTSAATTAEPTTTCVCDSESSESESGSSSRRRRRRRRRRLMSSDSDSDSESSEECPCPSDSDSDSDSADAAHAPWFNAGAVEELIGEEHGTNTNEQNNVQDIIEQDTNVQETNEEDNEQDTTEQDTQQNELEPVGEVSETQEEVDYTIGLSDFTLLNLWGIFTLLMVANILCCWLCARKRKTGVAELEEDGGSRLDVRVVA